MHIRAGLLSACLILLLPQFVHAQEGDARPGQYRSIVFIGVVAERAPHCELLRPWQGAALHLQVRDATRAWSEALQADLSIDIAAQAEATPCDEEVMNAWLDGGAREGIEREMLPHFLLAYRAFATMDPQPDLFRDAKELDDDAIVAGIEAWLEGFDMSAPAPEGAKTWGEFVDDASADFRAAITAYENNEDPPRATRQQVEDWTRASVEIAELWFAEAG